MTLYENPSLFKAMETALLNRQKKGVPIRDISTPMPSSAPDLFSNDYLSLSTDQQLRQNVLDRLNKAPHILGTTGTRTLCGTPSQLIALEERLQQFWDAPGALLCNSGYDANLAFFRSVPQSTDVVIYDELVHASIMDGLKASRVDSRALIPFSHNSVTALRERILAVVQKIKQLGSERITTVFIALESAYSMEGDFAPLQEMVTLIEELIPSGSFHIIVDEAHTTGIYGPKGRGFVSMLGLDRRIHTVLHTFGKGCGFFGAVLLTHPFIKLYLANYARPLIYSNSLPHCHFEGIHAILDYISSSRGDELRQTLQFNATYFQSRLIGILQNQSSNLLTPFPRTNLTLPNLTHPDSPSSSPGIIISPIFPILTPSPIPLAKYLQSLGYEAQPIPYPAVPKGQERIRIIVHAGNTEKDLDDMIDHLVEWIRLNEEEEGEVDDGEGGSESESLLTSSNDDVDSESDQVNNIHPGPGHYRSLMRELTTPFLPISNPLKLIPAKASCKGDQC